MSLNIFNILNSQVLNDGSLLISSIQENLASVVCTVENLHGKDTISYSLKVVKPPVAPTIRVSKITASSITLSWSLPHNGGALLQGTNIILSLHSALCTLQLSLGKPSR